MLKGYSIYNQCERDVVRILCVGRRQTMSHAKYYPDETQFPRMNFESGEIPFRSVFPEKWQVFPRKIDFFVSKNTFETTLINQCHILNTDFGHGHI